MNDIVYILKEGVEPDEIRYSLRSVCKNFPYKEVWFYGGKPEGITPDHYVEFRQKGMMPWEKVVSTIIEICRNKEISDDFWLFNDDFFIMKKVEDMPPYYDKTLLRRIQQIEGRRGGAPSLYSTQLRRTREALVNEGYRTLNYAVHMPMLINKKKALKVIMKYPKVSMFRSLYGNVYRVGGEQHTDVKIFDDKSPKKDVDFLSTTETSFRNCPVGEFIRERFPEKCKYED